MRVPSLVLVGSAGACRVAARATDAAQRGAPETFSANAQVKGAAGAIAATIQIQIDRYSPDFDRKSVEVGAQRRRLSVFPDGAAKGAGGRVCRHRRSEVRDSLCARGEDGKGRTITVVTDKPMFFVGGGRTDAKPRAGYEVGAVQMRWTMSVSAAARWQQPRASSLARRASACRWMTTPTSRSSW